MNKIRYSFLFLVLIISNSIFGYVDNLDTTWGVNANGIVTSTINSSSQVNGIAVDSNGNVIVAGVTVINTINNVLVARYTSVGVLDNTFGSNGIATYLSGSQSTANALAVDSTNKVVVAGNDGSNNLLLLRYTTAGVLDTTFGTGGVVTLTIGNGLTPNSILVDANGKIVVAGNANISGQINLFIARFTSAGAIDTTFGNNSSGYNTITANAYYKGNSLAIDTNAKLVVAGVASSLNGSDFLVARFNTNGQLDTTFNSIGIVTTTIPNYSVNNATSVSVDSSNRIVACGYSNNNNNSLFVIVRYTSSGTLDTGFGVNSNGVVTNAIGTNSQIFSSVIDANGNIVVGGLSDNNFAIARYNTNGSLDTTFENAGILLTTINAGSQIKALAFASGRVIAGGYETEYITQAQQVALVKYNKNNVDFVNITSIPDNGSVNTKIPSISGTSSAANAQVQVLVNGAAFNTVSTDSSGNWTAGSTNVLPIGANTIQANLIVSSVTVVSHTTKFTVVDNLSEDAVFVYNTTNQTKTSSTFSALPFNNTPILGTWTYSNSVFTCNKTGRYFIQYVGHAGSAALAVTVTSGNVATMVSINGTEYLGSESNTHIDLVANSIKSFSKGFVKDLTAGQTISLNYGVTLIGSVGSSTPGLIVSSNTSGTQHAYSLAITRIG